ncbi:MAG: hypothetical protein AAF383_25745 [Cyanobacteria bacterium P01_A01_bin.83]
MLLNKVKNIPHKLKRELYRIPALNALKEQAYHKALEHHTQFLPSIDLQRSLIVDALRKEGTCILPIENLELSSTDAMLKKAFSLAENLCKESSNTENCEVGSAKEDLREFPEILFWALEPKLLDLIENYIGLPILYQGFAMRRSIADGKYSGVRRWHIDWEDQRIIKIIIYLNDVVPGGGPYEYIPRQMTSEAIKTLNYYNLGFLSDAEMSQAVPQKYWQACVASKGSVVITDTSHVFHRAQPPTEQERFSITFCYTSTTPQVIWRSRKISRKQWQLVDSSLNQRQRGCLTKRRYG